MDITVIFSIILDSCYSDDLCFTKQCPNQWPNMYFFKSFQWMEWRYLEGLEINHPQCEIVWGDVRGREGFVWWRSLLQMTFLIFPGHFFVTIVSGPATCLHPPLLPWPTYNQLNVSMRFLVAIIREFIANMFSKEVYK